jgi:predicted site-specific integrase-resolvase
MITLIQAAKKLGIYHKTLYGWVRRGHVQATKHIRYKRPFLYFTPEQMEGVQNFILMRKEWHRSCMAREITKLQHLLDKLK